MMLYTEGMPSSLKFTSLYRIVFLSLFQVSIAQFSHTDRLGLVKHILCLVTVLMSNR